MKNELNELLDTIASDYKDWTSQSGINPDENYKDMLKVQEGRKYIKIVGDRGSVWGFIVKEDGGKFRKGDILKAASYSSPATNAARGNIMDGGYIVRWTGPLYLK